MALRVKVCRVDDVGPGESQGFAVAGIDIPIMVSNIDGEIIATTSMCPHEDVSLLDGDRRDAVVVCPGHAYEFNLRTGKCAHDRSLELRRYRVTIIGRDVFVDLV